MDRGSTIFLKVAIVLIGIIILALCVVWLPSLAGQMATMKSEVPAVHIPIMIIMYGAAVPFFVALYQAFNILKYIDQSKAFSYVTVQALKKIKYSAVAISVMYATALPFLYFVADGEDAPGIIIIGIVISFASMVIAVFAAVLHKLLQDAIAIKSEHDLTV